MGDSEQRQCRTEALRERSRKPDGAVPKIPTNNPCAARPRREQTRNCRSGPPSEVIIGYAKKEGNNKHYTAPNNTVHNYRAFPQSIHAFSTKRCTFGGVGDVNERVRRKITVRTQPVMAVSLSSGVFRPAIFP